MGSLRIALAQINPTVGDLEGNFRIIADWIERAKSHRADLVLFPELALAGYLPEDLLLHSAFVTDNLNLMEELVPLTKDIAAVVGFVDRDKYVRNAAAVLSDGEWIGTYYKHLLPNYDVFDEARYFEPGDDYLVVADENIRIGLTICEDVWEPGPPCEVLAEAGRANLLLNLSASPYHAGKVHNREAMMAERARSHGLYFVFCNLVGGQDELIFSGRSAVFDPMGEIIARAKAFEEDLLLVDIDALPSISSQESGVSAGAIREIGLSSLGEGEAREPVEPRIEEPYSDEEAIFRALSLGTRDYFRKNGIEKALIGLSGGIDSALVAVIAVDALGAENVTAVYMPSRFSSIESEADAHQLAESLAMKLIFVSIDELYESALETLALHFADSEPDVTEENLQARIRGMLLMALSNKSGAMVLTTGNKSEYSVGYTTLYGDMVGGLAVIKDLSKEWVYRLSRWLNRDSELIPERIITKAPSAELREDQRDEDDLPAPYEELDEILAKYIEREMSIEEIAAEGHTREVVEKVLQAVDRNEYKRRQSAFGLRITARAFGKDRRYPITNRYHSQTLRDRE